MTALRVSFGILVGIGAIIVAGGATAQDSLDRDKTPAQLFASDCAICHKSPQGLAKAGGLFGVQSFLRQHYTASKETAAAIANYLEAVDRAAGPGQRTAPPRRAAKKPGDKKPDAKPGEAKGEMSKASDAKPSEGKGSDAKPSESNSNEHKPVEPKAAETKPAETKTNEAKPEAAKPN